MLKYLLVTIISSMVTSQTVLRLEDTFSWQWKSSNVSEINLLTQGMAPGSTGEPEPENPVGFPTGKFPCGSRRKASVFSVPRIFRAVPV